MRSGAVLVADADQPAGDQVHRLLPAGLAEVGHHLVVIDQATRLAPPAALALHVPGQRALGIGVLAADQRRGQPLRRAGVVPAVAALDAQPALGAGLLAALGERDRLALVVDVVGERAADAAVGADGVDLAQLGARPDGDVVQRLVGQRPGRARRDAFAAGDARGLAHRVVEVERDPGGVALAAAADDVVALDVVAGPHAAVAQDAGVVVDRDHGVGVIDAAALALGQLLLVLARRRTGARGPAARCRRSSSPWDPRRGRAGRTSSSSVSVARWRSSVSPVVVTSIPSSQGRTQAAA